MRLFVRSWVWAGMVLLGVAACVAQEADTIDAKETIAPSVVETEGKDASKETDANTDKEEQEIPPGRTSYLGRRIAQTMHYAGAPWLIRESREREEGCSTMLDNLGVKPGMTVCDMGCGNGFYALKLAKLVGEKGRVLGVDIQPEMLTLLKLRAKEAEMLERIQPVLGSVVDPRLPKGKVDLILCADVYHEFSHPERMLKQMRESLSEKGLIVLLEFRAEDPDVPIKRLHKMSKAQVLKEMNANGLKLAKEYDGLPWQHMMFFGRDKSASE